MVQGLVLKDEHRFKEFKIRFSVVMLRVWVFRASGGLRLLCIGPRAGRAFLYQDSGLFRAF